MNKFLFVQYTGGAGGRAVSCCLQTAHKVGSWWNHRPNPETLASQHSNNTSHTRQEPDAEYKLSWLSRTYGIDRGNNLTKEQVNDLLNQEELLEDVLKNKKYIIVPWHKHPLPQWFEGTLIQIINDNQSFSWLTTRRKKLFYVETDEGVIETRYDSRYHPRPERNDRRVSSLPIDELVLKQLKEENIILDPTAHQIQLSWLLGQQWSQVFDMLENAINDNIDRVWCEQYLTAWHKRVV